MGVIAAVLSILFVIAAPTVAFPLAMVLRKGRQAIDNMLNWRGNNHEQMESIEDAITHGAAWLVGILVFVGVGAVYVWYFQSMAFEIHPWLYSLLDRFPWIDLKVDFINVGVVLYWTIVYSGSFVLGWRKAGRG